MAGLRVADAAAPARSLRPAVAAATPSGLYLLTPDWDDTSRLLAVSAAAAALISAVFDAPDPAAAAAELIQRWNSAQSGRMGGP
jgi:hypothetical protein